jgi:hypothetical protein
MVEHEKDIELVGNLVVVIRIKKKPPGTKETTQTNKIFH